MPKSTSSATFVLAAYISKISFLPPTSGRGTATCLSKRPGRNNALSSDSAKLVAPMTIIPLFSSNPSIWTSNSFNVCLRADWSFNFLVPPTASISSMKIIEGDFCLAASNNSRIRLAPRPTYTSSNCDPEAKKNGTPASPAIAFARRVLPVPGGPVNNNPRGNLPPNLVNLSGSFKYSTISSNSFFASVTPLTSSNRTSLPSAS
mmetsp:Transcript_6623/g.11128  ORF Transcript_6623/g.11128 Transcript_6623/m.11128 type:complete len:204 (+) Transcript_6623:658-1269(+)